MNAVVDKPDLTDLLRRELEGIRLTAEDLNNALFRTRALLYHLLGQEFQFEVRDTGDRVAPVKLSVSYKFRPIRYIGEDQMSPASWEKLFGPRWETILEMGRFQV